MKMSRLYMLLIMLLALCVGCGNAAGTQSSTADIAQEMVIPTFDADSAYNNVARQVAFGYRIPGTDAHKATAQWLAEEMARYGAEVIRQEATVTAYDGTALPMCNIIAQFAPEKSNRILLAAHWDSRPYADYDSDVAARMQPIDGANDGASGVGVLLEVARHIGAQEPLLGVDIILFDAEDYGAPEWVDGDTSDTWALGSQYWSTHPHKPGYRARYGILLDMVGAAGVGFYREYFSERYASHIVDKVWNCAAELGYDGLFVNQQGGAITDDHLNIIRAGIPAIDIIQHDPTSHTGFFAQWHTHDDDMEHIDRSMLDVVGQVIMTVIYSEK